jgi:hypothetical protein
LLLLLVVKRSKLEKSHFVISSLNLRKINKCERNERFKPNLQYFSQKRKDAKEEEKHTQSSTEETQRVTEGRREVYGTELRAQGSEEED